MKNIFDRILTVQEAAERYKMNPKYIQQVLWKGKRLKVGRDCIQKGNMWLILDEAARRLWGYRLVTCPPGFRVCRKCLTPFPEDEQHFKLYRVKGVVGLMNICRGCINLTESSRYQKNKMRLRPIRREYMRGYRSKYPEREAAAVKRYKLKRSIKRLKAMGD